MAATRNRKEVERQVSSLHVWLADMSAELKASKREAQDALRQKSRASKLASRRLALLREMKVALNECSDELAAESQSRNTLERMQTIQLQIKRERAVGRRGGGSKWPVHIVLLICELLVAGTPPSAVPGNLQATSAYFTGSEASELPRVGFVRHCRVVVQSLNETMAALRLGKADT